MADQPKTKKKGNYEEITYNLGGVVPNESVWDLSVQRLREVILKCAQDIIPDFSVATVESNPSNGTVVAYVWLSKDSKHITDKSLEKNPDAAIKQSIAAASPELKNFTNRFCPSGRNRAIPEEVNNSNEKPKRYAFMVSIPKMLEVYFDVKGIAFEKEFGYKPSECFIEISPRFDDRKDERNSKLEGIRVRKCMKTYRDMSNPIPKKSFKRN